MHTVSLAFPFDAASGTGMYGYGVGLILAMLEGMLRTCKFGCF